MQRSRFTTGYRVPRKETGIAFLEMKHETDIHRDGRHSFSVETVICKTMSDVVWSSD